MKFHTRAIRRILLTAITLTAPHSLFANDALICIEEVSGGLKFLDGQWQGVKFRSAGAQFLVVPINKGSSTYEVKQIGQNSPKFTCERRSFGVGSLADQMVCGGLGFGMLINFTKLRYVEIYSLGYIDDDQSGRNTPSVTGGKCTTFSP